jgi:CubicO group peptidase (beta-lactamase class C family)
MKALSFSLVVHLLLGSHLLAQTSPASLVKHFMEEGRVPGSFVAVVSGDSVVYQQSFGIADKEKRTLMTPNTCMELGSV